YHALAAPGREPPRAEQCRRRPHDDRYCTLATIRFAFGLVPPRPPRRLPTYLERTSQFSLRRGHVVSSHRLARMPRMTSEPRPGEGKHGGMLLNLGRWCDGEPQATPLGRRGVLVAPRSPVHACCTERRCR